MNEYFDLSWIMSLTRGCVQRSVAQLDSTENQKRATC